ncbi:non-ribosomal peptide synthetase [Streptomyces sp. cg40]|uniref:non-ribosomal peptide synthetase n=1 Tax=Streptomyces sp. cg40 TaxID=3419764 RepID=UPI003D040521
MLSDIPAPEKAGLGNGSAPFLQLFAAQVAAAPDATAVRSGRQTLTFRELDEWSGRLATQLADRGVRPGGIVALAADRGPAALAGVLAILRTGAGYLGLDPAVPARRQRRMIEEVAPDCVLAEPGLDQFPTLDAPRVRLAEVSEGPVLTAHDSGDSSTSVFHIVYTSGTTGAPKGVRVSRGSVFNRLLWMWSDHPFKPGAVIAVQKSVSLVASPWEMLGGLLQGIPSVFLSREEVLDPALFADAVVREHLTHLFLTPHLVTGLLDEVDRRGGLAHQPTLVTSGADALPVTTALRFRELLPGTTLLNLYGMTETASNVAAYDVSALAPDAERVPVGKPVAGASLTVHDRLGRELPPGVVGEVWVAGPPLALGYVRDGDSDRFATGADGVRRYRTGDRGRLSSDGNLEIVGRSDNQVKIRGYRVELEEVETTLRTSPFVADAGVYVAEEQGEPRLIACVTEAVEADPAALRAYVRDRLPDYMVPSRIIVLPDLPLGTNGKLDRSLLRTRAESVTHGPRERFAPTDDTESVLVGLWEQLLGTAPATADENFFDAGGHSLLAVRLTNRLEKAFGRRVSLRQLLGAPTFSGIAALCREAGQGVTHA